jgi:type VI secretion system protein ImpK
MNASAILSPRSRNADDDKTVVVSSVRAAQPSYLGDLSFELAGYGLNPLLDAATPLIGLATRARNLPPHPDIEGLRLLVINELKRFEQTLDGLDCDRATTLAARYCLCGMIDQAILGTDWGSNGPWSAQSMLSYFHNETWSGEKFFLILARLLQEPARHQQMIELLYVCLQLGFRGKYAVIENGQAKLDVLMENVHDVLRRLRPEYSEVLSDCWSTRPRPSTRLVAWLSIRVVLALAVIGLGTLFFLLHAELDEIAAPVSALLSVIGGVGQ